jgi:hypothetical protein
LDRPKKVERLLEEYQICCFCKSAIKTFAREHLHYYDIIELIKRAMEKLIFSQGKFRRRDFTKGEALALGFFRNNPLSEKEDLLHKLRYFFLS